MHPVSNRPPALRWAKRITLSWTGAAILLAGCAQSDHLATESEAEDTLRTLREARLADYSPPAPEFFEKNIKVLPENTRESFNSKVSDFPKDTQALEAGSGKRARAAARREHRVILRPAYNNERLATLSDADRKALSRLMSPFLGRENMRIQVTGHSSSLRLQGEAKKRFRDNQNLSLERADNVATEIRRLLSLPEEVVTTAGVGDSQPLPGVSPRAGSNRRVVVVIDAPPKVAAVAAFESMPAGFTPWWNEPATGAIVEMGTHQALDVESLMVSAIEHSTQIQVFKDIPLIRDTATLEAEGEFDPHVFVQARYRRINEPVGSTLRTGGPPRFREDNFETTVGVRKKVFSGGQAEVSQRIGLLDNNSVFFQPVDQALTRFRMSFTQPLLNGAGFEYNRSTVRVAMLDREIAMDEFQRQLEAHLLEVIRAYWSLYRERSALIIKTRLAQEAQDVVSRLEARRRIDALEHEIVRARAALAARRSETVRAGAGIRNAEARLSALTNDPSIRPRADAELVTSQPPVMDLVPIEVPAAARHALHNRPEINQAMKQLRAGMVRLRMSENELLPVLDLIVGAEWNGLRGDRDVGSALRAEFDEGGIGYDVGVVLDVALGNRTARARHQRRRLEVRQLTNQLRTTIETLLLEVQVSARELETSRRDMQSRYAAMTAARTQSDTVLGRLGLPGDKSLQLDRLLSAQERLAEEEERFLDASVSFNLARANLDRAMGVLMQTRGLEPRRVQGIDGDLPTLELK